MSKRCYRQVGFAQIPLSPEGVEVMERTVCNYPGCEKVVDGGKEWDRTIFRGCDMCGALSCKEHTVDTTGYRVVCLHCADQITKKAEEYYEEAKRKRTEEERKARRAHVLRWTRFRVCCGDFREAGLKNYPALCCDSCHDDVEEGYGEFQEVEPPQMARHPRHDSYEKGVVAEVCCSVARRLDEIEREENGLQRVRDLFAKAIRIKRRRWVRGSEEERQEDGHKCAPEGRANA